VCCANHEDDDEYNFTSITILSSLRHHRHRNKLRTNQKQNEESAQFQNRPLAQ